MKIYTFSRANTVHQIKVEIQKSKSPSPEEPNGEDEGVGGRGVERVDQDDLGEDGVVQPVGALRGKSEPACRATNSKSIFMGNAGESTANLFYLE